MNNHLARVLQGIDRLRPRSVTGWVILFLVASVLALFVRTAVRFHQINRFQYAIERKFEILYFHKGRKAHLTENPLEQRIYRICDTWANKFRRPIDTDYWDARSGNTYAGPLIALLHGRITGIWVYDGETFTPELGRSLQAFKALEFFRFETYREDIDAVAQGSLIAGVSRLPKLQRLELGGPWLSAAQLRPLLKMRRLEVLILQYPKIDAEGLAVLQQFRQLQTLEIINCNLSLEEMWRIKRALPNTQLRINNEETEEELKDAGYTDPWADLH